MKYTAAVIFAFSIFINACNNNGSNNVKGKDAYETTKETLEQVEQNNPVRFLKIWVKDKKTLLAKLLFKAQLATMPKWLLIKILTLSFLILVKRVLWCSRTELLFMTVWRRGKA